MTCINDQLLRRFVVCVLAVAEKISITRQERHRHEHAITPELPLATLAGGMPEATIFCSWVGVEPLSNSIRRQFVFSILLFLIKQQLKVTGQHTVEIVVFDLARYSLRIGACNNTVCVNVRINPVLDVLQVSWFASALVNEILSVQVE